MKAGLRLIKPITADAPKGAPLICVGARVVLSVTDGAGSAVYVGTAAEGDEQFYALDDASRYTYGFDDVVEAALRDDAGRLSGALALRRAYVSRRYVAELVVLGELREEDSDGLQGS